MAMDIAKIIVDNARRTGADPTTMLATAIVESGLDPKIVGDNGTSYGLFQMHVGGAGGRTHDEAKRYLDPQTVAENRARFFKGGKGGAFAASVQRPADPSGYARKVDAIIAQLRAGKHPAAGALSGAASPAKSVTGASTGTPAAAPVKSDNKAAALAMIFGDDPFMQAMIARRPAETVDPGFAPTKPAPTAATPASGGKGTPKRRKGETGQQYLDRVLIAKFGLKHDPGNSQTTGGRHATNSGHYRSTASDFGDAKNSPATLQKAEDWAEANAGALGIKQVIYGGDEDANHADHAHFETKFAAKRPIKKPARPTAGTRGGW